MKIVITDEERQAFMKEFSDRKRNDIGSDRTDDIEGEEEENLYQHPLGLLTLWTN